jgi:hypothetical protein
MISVRSPSASVRPSGRGSEKAAAGCTRDTIKCKCRIQNANRTVRKTGWNGDSTLCTPLPLTF